MRVVSLLPAATEALYGMGLGDLVVGRTHACDHPPQAAAVAVVTSPGFPDGLPARDLERRLASRRDGAFVVDAARLAALRPDVVVARHPEAGHGVDAEAVRGVLRELGIDAAVHVYDPRRLSEVPEAIAALGDAVAGRREGLALASFVRRRLAWVADAVAGRRPTRVAVFEWPDPPQGPGRWVPDLVATAGGRAIGGRPDVRSPIVDLAEVAAADPEVVLLAFRGFHLSEVRRRFAELRLVSGWEDLAARSPRIIATDAEGVVTRPGPRVTDGAEGLAWVLHRPHPDLRPGRGTIAEWDGTGWSEPEPLSGGGRAAAP